MNNDEFVKRIKEIGKIKDVREAFIKYPVEEEEHKGKLESYITVAEEGKKYYYNKDSIVKLDEVYRKKEEAISFKIGKVDEYYKKRYLEINE